jgi:PAP2 superfamily
VTVRASGRQEPGFWQNPRVDRAGRRGVAARSRLTRPFRPLGRGHRPTWWHEVGLIAVCYLVYSAVRDAVPGHEVAARHRAVDLLALERSLHLAIEQQVNMFVAHTSWLAYICNYYYATLHFFVTVAVLIWLYLRHPSRYRAVRSVLFAANAVALLGFWLFALAPPRMLRADGFIDTVVAFHTWGSWGSSGIDSAANQFAAMPSLHIGWALWCAATIVKLAERRWVRVLGVLYPCVTFFVIVGTANHFVVDAVGGVVAVLAGFAVQWAVSGRTVFEGRRIRFSRRRVVRIPPEPAGWPAGSPREAARSARPGSPSPAQPQRASVDLSAPDPTDVHARA